MNNKISKPVTNCNNNKYVNPDYYSVVVVQTLQERDNIPCKLRQNGTIAIVVEGGYAQYQIQTKEGIYSVCNNNSWVQVETGNIVFDGNNLIILNDETHKQEYLQSGLAVEGQMVFFVPEQKYYTYDGIGLGDPFPNKLDKPTQFTNNPDEHYIPVYDNNLRNPEWLPSNTLGKVVSVNNITPTPGTKNINLNLSNIPNDVGYATNTELTQLTGALDAKINKGSLISNDDSLLIEGENIEVKLSIYSEEFKQKTFNLAFTPINILGIYKNGIYLRSSEFVLNLPKSITINNYNLDDIVIVQYQHLKTDI